jgi:hypothetical protein
MGTMKKPFVIASIIVALLASLGVWLYNTYSILKTKPPVPLTTDIVLDQPTSVFNLPVIIDHSVLENYLNSKTSGEFLKADFWLQKKKKEQVSLVLSRQENLTLSSSGSELFCTVPVTADARLTDSRFGKTLARLLVKPVHAKAVITLSTPIDIDRRWRLVTHFRIRSVQWEEEPVVRIGPFKKHIVADIDTLLIDNSYGLTTLLDREINKAAGIAPTISDVWHDLQDPIRIARKPVQIWLRFRCNDITARFALQKNRIVCNTRIETSMRMLTDTTSMRKPTPLPPFRLTPKGKVSALSDINFFSLIPFSTINSHLNDYFRNKTISRKGYRIVIRNIRAYASSKGLSIAVMTDRDLRGHFIMSGRLNFDVPRHTLKIEDFDYAIDTGNPIVNTGDIILHDAIRDSIATKLDLQIGDFVTRLPSIITKAVSTAKAGKTIDLDIDSLAIRKCEIRMGKDNVYLLVNAISRNSLRLKRIKPGKAIRIRKGGVEAADSAAVNLHSMNDRRPRRKSMQRRLNTDPGGDSLTSSYIDSTDELKTRPNQTQPP